MKRFLTLAMLSNALDLLLVVAGRKPTVLLLTALPD
jgi:hypothetical protein